MLRKYLIIFVLVALCASSVGFAQEAAEEEVRQGWGVFGTFIEGDEASKKEQDGFLSTLDDSVGAGALFYRDMSQGFRFEARVAYLPSTMLNTENGDVDAALIYFDFSLMPRIRLGQRAFLGIPMGLGWAMTRSSEKYIDQLFGRSPGLGQEDGSGMIYFLGFQYNQQVGEDWEFFGDLRARRFHRLVNVEERTLKSFELSIGFTKKF